MSLSHCVCKPVHSVSAASNVLTGPSVDCKIWSPRSHLSKSHPHQCCTWSSTLGTPDVALTVAAKAASVTVGGSPPTGAGWGVGVLAAAPPAPAPFAALLSTLDRLARALLILSLAGAVGSRTSAGGRGTPQVKQADSLEHQQETAFGEGWLPREGRVPGASSQSRNRGHPSGGDPRPSALSPLAGGGRPFALEDGGLGSGIWTRQHGQSPEWPCADGDRSRAEHTCCSPRSTASRGGRSARGCFWEKQDLISQA